MTEQVQEHIFQTLNRITQVIERHPLIQKLSHLVDIQAAVVGGAVRDSFLGKPVKDIDIAIHFNFYHHLKVDYPRRKPGDDDFHDQFYEADALGARSKEILNLMGSEDFAVLHNFLLSTKGPVSATHALVWLIQHILAQEEAYEIKTVFQNANEDVDNDLNTDIRNLAYKNFGLTAVVAIADQQCDYPIELLFTTDSFSRFIHKFDFNICKIHMTNQDGLPQVEPTKEFLQDVQNMTMTYQPSLDLTEARIKKSLLVRFPRLYEKLSEYDLVCDLNMFSDENIKAVVDLHLNSSKLYCKLQKMPSNTYGSRTRKI